MKHLFLVVALFAVCIGMAQDFQGVAVYESKSSAKITVSGNTPQDKEMEAMLQKLTQKTYVLAFNKAESLYEEQEQLERPGASLETEINAGMGDKVYKNLKDKTYVRQMDMMGKEFLIQDSLHKQDWVLVNETKKIGDYTCYKATYTIVLKPLTEEEQEKAKGLTGSIAKDLVVTAWYAPQMPVSHGPGDYWGLPGLMLEVNNGSTTILCSKITLNPKEKVAIKKPAKGQKVTQDEFREIIEKKMEEMNEMYSEPKNSGGTTITKKTTTVRVGG